MSFIWAIGFNENDTNNVRDYSDSNKDATTVTALSVVTDSFDDGFYALGDGTDTFIEVTAGGGITYSEPFTKFIQFYVPSGIGDGYLNFREDHSYLFYDSVAGNLEAAVWDNGGSVWITTTKAVSVDTWYKAMLTYSDTNKQRLFLDTVEFPDTNATDASPQDTNPERVFSDDGDPMSGTFFAGRIREFWSRDEELDNDNDNNEVQATFFESQGKPLKITAHGWVVGQLTQSFNSDPVKVCIFLVVDADNVRVRIISGQNPTPGEKFYEVGHRWDTTLQHLSIAQGTLTNPRVGVYDGISKFTDVGVESKQVAVYDKDGFRRKGNPTRITANVTIESQDRWIMFDVSGGGLTAQLPANPKDWEEHTLEDAEGSCNAGVNLITIDGNGNNINGVATATLQNSRASKSVIYDTTEWIIYQEQ